MEKHIIKIDKDTLPQMFYALALGKQQAGVDATDTSILIVGDELHILGGIEEVYTAGLMIGTAIGLLAQTYPLNK